MKSSKVGTGAVALCTVLMIASAAGAQDRGYFQQRADEAMRGETVALRWTLPFGGRAKDRDAAPKLALSFSQASAEGAVQSMDLASLSFAGGQRRIDSPFQANFGEGAGHWIAAHPLLATLGAGLVIWGVAEATKEDSAPKSQCGSNSNSQSIPVESVSSKSC